MSAGERNTEIDYERRLGRRYRVVAIGFGIACLAYLVVILGTLLVDTHDAPWLSGKGDTPVVVWVILTYIAVGFLGGVVHGVIDVRRAVRRGSRPTDPAYFLGFKWLFTGRRLWMTGFAIAASFAMIAIASVKPELRDEAGLTIDSRWWIMSLTSMPWAIWAVVLKGRELRRGKERIKVADEYLAIREDRLNQEFSAMVEKFFQQQQNWRAEKTAELYEQVLDQQARGVLPCPNCEGRRKPG